MTACRSARMFAGSAAARMRPTQRAGWRSGRVAITCGHVPAGARDHDPVGSGRLYRTGAADGPFAPCPSIRSTPPFLHDPVTVARGGRLQMSLIRQPPDWMRSRMTNAVLKRHIRCRLPLRPLLTTGPVPAISTCIRRRCIEENAEVRGGIRRRKRAMARRLPWSGQSLRSEDAAPRNGEATARIPNGCIFGFFVGVNFDKDAPADSSIDWLRSYGRSY